MNKKKKNNIAFIDGQNLYKGAQLNNPGWKLNLKKLRKYLYQKYDVKEIYYFIGYALNEYKNLYFNIQDSGYKLCFRQYNCNMTSQQKGNVDSDIIFNIMKKIYLKEDFHKIIIISGDGDYKMLIDFLIKENKFQKILFPNYKYASSLYKKMSHSYWANLNDIKNKICK